MIDYDKIQNVVRNFLIAIGENPEREGLIETPKRVADMCTEIFSGYDMNLRPQIKVFNSKIDTGDFIIVNDVPVYSVCEHHLLPFFGHANIVYQSKNNQVLGLSKFNRVVEYFSRRLQIQENLTKEISNFLYDNLNPDGIAVHIEAKHLCMMMRGIKNMNSVVHTFSFNGTFSVESHLKKEVIDIIK